MALQVMKTILNMIDLRIMFSHPNVRAQYLHLSFVTHEVIRGIDLDVPWGAVTAIAGSNGAGKSTLIAADRCLTVDAGRLAIGSTAARS